MRWFCAMASGIYITREPWATASCPSLLWLCGGCPLLPLLSSFSNSLPPRPPVSFPSLTSTNRACLVICAFPGDLYDRLGVLSKPSICALSFVLAPTGKLCPIQGVVTGWETLGDNPQNHLIQIPSVLMAQNLLFVWGSEKEK